MNEKLKQYITTEIESRVDAINRLNNVETSYAEDSLASKYERHKILMEHGVSIACEDAGVSVIKDGQIICEVPFVFSCKRDRSGSYRILKPKATFTKGF